jgi:hypothetical protein
MPNGAVRVSRKMRVAHFPEGALSGYAGIDFASFEGFGWDRLADRYDIGPGEHVAVAGTRDRGRAAQRDTGPRSALGEQDEPVAADKRSLNLLSPPLLPAPTLGSRTKEGVSR